MTRDQRRVISVLKKARRLISKPERWTKDHDAVDVWGCPCNPLDVNAASYCAIGATSRAAETYGEAIDLAADMALRHGLRTSVDVWNDRPHRTHAEVLARFDRTIARLEGAK